MKNFNDFEIEMSSDLDYEELVANVLYKKETVATLSQENGIESINIEIFTPYDEKSWNFLLEDFLHALQFGKKRLIEMYKLPDKEE